MRVSPRVQRASLLLRLARRVLESIVVIAAVLPLYLLLKQAITPDLESFAWPPLWLPHRPTAEHLASVVGVTELRSALVLSLVVALASAAMSSAMGAMLGWAMARSARCRRAGMGAISGVRLLPMIAVAIPLAIRFIELGLYNSPTGGGLALIHSALALPTAAIMSWSAFAAIPREVEEAAWLDGASPLRVFLSIDLPLARAALAASFILGFILSWDEFGFALLIQVTNRTLGPLLYYYTVFGDVGAASALALVMMIPAIAVIVALRPMLRGNALAGGFR